MDTESTLQEYQIQLEQVEISLKSNPENEELLKLKSDLIEVIALTQELLKEESDENYSKNSIKNQKNNTNTGNNINIEWKTGDKCMAKWRVDGKYYPATVDQIVEDGQTCTVIFDGYATNEITQVSQLMPLNKNSSNILNSDNYHLTGNKTSLNSQLGHKKAFTKKEIELKLRETKKRKREKFALKLKALEDLSEKEKNKWKTFNSKLSSKTWKGVVNKNKFEIPDNHENKIGVGTNSATNRIINANGAIISTNSNASASATITSNLSKSRHTSQSYKTTMFN